MIISHKEAMDILHQSETFDLEFVTADDRRKTGGRLMCIENGHLGIKKPSEAQAARLEKGFRNSHANMTRTIHRPDGHPVDVHIYLMTRINGKEISLA